MRIRTLIVAMLVGAMALTSLLFATIWVVHSRLDVLLQAQASSQAVLRETSALLVLTNEFALHGSERESEQWRQRQRRILDLLYAARGADPAVVAELTQQVDSLRTFFERLVETKGASDARLQKLRQELLMDQVLLKTQTLFDETDRWSSTARANERRLEELFHALVLALPCIMLLVLIGMAYLLSRRVLQPLSQLSDAVRAVAKGDLSVRTPAARQDEVGEVSRIFDALALDLVSQLRNEVADRRRAENALTLQSSRLQAILDAEPECVMLLGPELGIADINRSGLEWIEASGAEQAKSSGLQTFIDEEHRGEVLALIRRVAQGKSDSVEFRMRGLRGSERWVQAYLTPLTDSAGNTEILVVARDVTLNKKLTMELERRAHVDFLTQLNNRGRFMQLAEAELARAVRYGMSVSVLMLDVDHFKKVNDTHGHKVGDEALVRLADVCKKTLRPFDIIGRLGGEEFAVLLPQTDAQRALEVAERLRGAIADTQVPLAQGLPLHFTVSIGVSTQTSAAENLDTLLSRADEALYAAKAQGRDRVRLDAVAPDARPVMKLVIDHGTQRP